MTPLVTAHPVAAEAGDIVCDRGSADFTGGLRTASYSSRLKKNIGFAMLSIEYADMGNKFEVDTQHGRTCQECAQHVAAVL